MAISPERSETFSHLERAAIRQILEKLAESQGLNDAIDLIVENGIAPTLGVKIQNENGLYRMIRNDPEIHNFLRKIYDPVEE